MHLQRASCCLDASLKVYPGLCLPCGVRAGGCVVVGKLNWARREGIAKRMCFQLWVGYLMLILRTF